MSFLRKCTGGVVAAALLVPMALASAASTPPDQVQAEVHAYIVQLVEPPAAAGARPAPGQHLDRRNPAVARYADNLGRQQAAVARGAGVADSARFYSYRYSFNGFAADLTPAQVARLLQDPAVLAVHRDRLDQPHTDNTPSFLGLDEPGGLWAQAGGQGAAGEDVIVGVIDTGIWPEHPSFSDQADLADRPGRAGDASRVYDAPPSHWQGTCQGGEQWSKDDCNNKLIGARYFLAGFGRFGIERKDFGSARDADGHGTHTASTAAGNAGVHPSIFGRDFGIDSISGMAPRARVAAYKACWTGGCATSDLVAAIDTAVIDGVDVINYSIGSDTPSLLSPDAVSFLFAADANVFVAASAGNSGPEAATVGSPASAPWLTSVGASTHDRFLQGSVALGNGATYHGASVTRGLPSRPLVDGEDAGSAGCEAGALDPAVVTGKIVLCEGSRLRAARGLAVAAAGGVGMVLYAADAPQMQFSDNHFLPAVHLARPAGLEVKAYIDAAGPAATAAVVEGGAVDDVPTPAMTHFSSRGENGAAADVIKPDVTAPGMQVLAGNTPVALGSAPGQLFQAISGTSMSSPHVAGIGALLRQAHRTWSPEMIRSSLMTTASQDVTKEDRSTPADAFDFGAGHIRPNPATDPGLVYDAGFLDYVAFLCGTGELSVETCTDPAPNGFGIQPIDPSDLNLPSIGVGELAGAQTVRRTVTNLGPAATYTASVEAPAGVSAVVEPAALVIPEGGTATYSVTFTSTPAATLNEWAFGSLTWSDGAGHNVRSPLAVRPVGLSAPVEVTGTGTSGDATWDVTFGYTGPFTATPLGLVPSTTENATVADDPANDINVALQTGTGIREHTITVAPGTEHLRTALFDEATDGEDDLDLYLFDPAGEFAGDSASATSTEQVDVPNPIPGTWRIVVHGWQTDGADASYTLFSWLVPNSATGNLAVTAPATATLAQTLPIQIAWTGLTAGVRYLGAVLYTNGTTRLDRTLVSITG